MYCVICPDCGDVIEIPDDAVGVDRTDPWYVVARDNCDMAFDYDNEEIQWCSDPE
jgi:hypothetical protein